LQHFRFEERQPFDLSNVAGPATRDHGTLSSDKCAPGVTAGQESRNRAISLSLSVLRFNNAVCGELLISPESAIRHTQESPVSNHEPYFASGARCWIYLSTPATLAMRA